MRRLVAECGLDTAHGRGGAAVVSVTGKAHAVSVIGTGRGGSRDRDSARRRRDRTAPRPFGDQDARRIRTSEPQCAADVDNSSREWPGWEILRECRAMRGIGELRPDRGARMPRNARNMRYDAPATNTCRVVDMEVKWIRLGKAAIASLVASAPLRARRCRDTAGAIRRADRTVPYGRRCCLWEAVLG